MTRRVFHILVLILVLYISNLFLLPYPHKSGRIYRAYWYCNITSGLHLCESIWWVREVFLKATLTIASNSLIIHRSDYKSNNSIQLNLINYQFNSISLIQIQKTASLWLLQSQLSKGKCVKDKVKIILFMKL